MEKIKVSELFYSLQGEGLHTGVPSVFLRTFGCNFKCRGFGMPKGELSSEYLNVKPGPEYTEYNSLPLVKTGCDSYPSWDNRFKHLSPFRSIDDIAASIVNLLPEKKWSEEHLIFTGGEPLLGWQKAYPNLLEHSLMKDLKHITFETNGTQSLSLDFFNYLNNWKWNNNTRELTFSVSVKLSCSGEPRNKALNTQAVLGYQRVGTTYLKFVVATEEDVEEALETIKIFRNAGFNGHVYLMPVGGVEEVYMLNNKRVAELALKNGLRYSDRLQVALFKNDWGT